MRRLGRLSTALLLALLAGPSALSGQAADYSGAPIPPDHWSIDALRRLDGLNLLPADFDAGAPLVSQRTVGRMLARAAADAPPHLDGLVRGWMERFDAEYGIDATDAYGAFGSARVLVRGSRVGPVLTTRDGAVRRGWGYVDGYPPGTFWMPATAVPDETEAGVAGVLQVQPHPALAGVYRDGPARTEELYGVAALGPVLFWAGDRALRYGPGRSGGVVLNGDAALRSAGFRTLRGFRLPWVLRHIGPVSLELALGETDLEYSFEDVFVLTTRGMVAPHQRLRLGVSRGAMFGGDGNTDVDLFAVFSVLIGKHAGDISELDNQVVAVDAQWVPPTERWLPLRLYVEWGFEDSAGAYTNVPGILGGVEVPAVPGLPALRLGVERVHFAPSCCDNPVWYRHATFFDGWTFGVEPAGHPLGGHGDQWSLEAGLAVLDARLRLDGRLFTRERGEENIFSPLRDGESLGGSGRLEAAALPWLELWAEGSTEDGEGWRESRLAVGLRALF